MDHKTVLVFLSTLVLVNCQSSRIRNPPNVIKCPNVTTEQHFNINKYMGLWYEIERFNIVVEANTNCISSNYSLLPNGSFAMNSSFVKDGKNQSMISLGREGNTTTHDGILRVSIPSYGDMEATIYVLGTDYVDYTILYACIERNISAPMELAWVLSRNSTLSPTKKPIVDTILQTNKINENKFIKTKHDPKTCWKKISPSSATISNANILLLSLTVILKYFL